MNNQVSYFDAPKVAMKMVEGLDYTAFYDEFKTRSGKKAYELNFNGVKVLAGIMGCIQDSVRVAEDIHEGHVTVEAHASIPNGNSGFSMISQPKQVMNKGKLVPDDMLMEKAFTRAKRNALRDLVPGQVFCEMLVKAHITGKHAVTTLKDVLTEKKPDPSIENRPITVAADTTALNTARTAAQQLAPIKKVSLMESWGLTLQDCLDHCEIALDKTQDEWNADGWKMLAKVMEDPVGMGVDQAVEIHEKSLNEEKVSETSETMEAVETPDPDLEKVEATEALESVDTTDDDLQQVLDGM